MKVVAALAVALFSMPTFAHADEADECAAAAEESQSLVAKKQLVQARSDLVRCARDTCPSVIKKDCVTWLDDLDKKLPSVVLGAKTPAGDDLSDVTVTINGAPFVTKLDGTAMPIDPGETVFRFTTPGAPPVEKKLVIAEGEKARPLAVVLAKGGEPVAPVETTSAAVKVAPWVLVGVSAASLAGFGVLQGVARGERSKLDDGCGKTKTCNDSELSPIRGKFVGSAVLFGVSIASLTAAVGIWVFAPLAKPSAPKVSFGVGPDGFHAGATFPLNL